VVARRVDVGGAALQVHQRTVEQRDTGGLTPVVGGPVELAVQRAAAGGEPLRERPLVGGQHADPEHPGAEHGVVPTGLDLGADQHEQGVERHGREGVGRHRVVVALGERGEHADPCREPAHGQPEARGVELVAHGAPSGIGRPVAASSRA
jgi:hypothetical protein